MDGSFGTAFDGFFGMGNGFFGLFPYLFLFVFSLIVVVLLVCLVRALAQWGKNNASPVLTVAARVVARRQQTDVRGHAGEGHVHSHTRYFATFEVQSGDRMEMCVPGREYGLLADGDAGLLTFQGTRFVGFERAAAPVRSDS